MGAVFKYGLVLALAAAAAGCERKTGAGAGKAPRGLGRPVAEGVARGVVASVDGRTLAYLAEVAPPAEKDAPEGVLNGTLALVPAGGPASAVRKLGGGVTTLENGFHFSPDGSRIAYLQGYRFRDQRGALFVAKVEGGEPQKLGDETSYYGFSPAGDRFAFIDNGSLKLGPAEGPFAAAVGEVATFDFGSDGKKMLVRRKAAAGGALLLLDLSSGKQQKLAENVADYNFAPQGDGVAFTAREGGPGNPYDLFLASSAGGGAKRVGKGVASFAFSPDGQHLAYLGGISPAKQFGDLEVVQLAPRPVAPRKLGEKVGEFRFSSDSKAIAFLDKYEPTGGGGGRGAGRLALVALPDGAVQALGEKVPSFLWSPKGAHLAFLQRIFKPVYSIDLSLYRLGEKEPAKVAQGVFSYDFPPGDQILLFRAACTRNGRACDLYSLPLSGPRNPLKLAEQIWGFRSAAKGGKLLVTYARFDSEEAADLGVVTLGEKFSVHGVDSFTQPGAVFLDPDGKRAAYVVMQRHREGVFAADLP